MTGTNSADTTTLAGRFELREELGRGGLATVWRGWDRQLEAEVAVKVLHEHLAHQRVVRERFRREVVLSRKLVHPAIVRVYDHYEEGTAVWFTMELVEGHTLEDHQRLAGPPSADERWRIIADLAEALDHAHRQGIVHRDVKPQNVMIGADDAVKILDFGLARVETMVGLTSHSVLLGTPDYMAPEAISGLPTDGRVDLYSLGVLWYRLATGELPFSAHTPFELLQKITTGEAPALVGPDVTEREREIVAGLLSREPEERFGSPAELLLAMRGDPVQVRSEQQAGGTRICPICRAEQTADLSFCQSCGVERNQIATTGDAMLALIRVDTGSGDQQDYVRDHPDLTDVLERLGACEIIDWPPTRRSSRLPATLLASIDGDYARVLQTALLEQGFTTDIRQLRKNNVDLLWLDRQPRIYATTGVVVAWFATMISLGWFYWRAMIVGGTVLPYVLLATLALVGLLLGFLVQFRTHWFLKPRYAIDPIAVAPAQKRLGQLYRAFLGSVSSPTLRRLGSQLVNRAYRMLAQVATTDQARSLERLTLESVQRGFDALRNVQALEAEAPAADTRKVWEALEAAETRARLARSPQQQTLELELAARHEHELQQLAEIEHERTRRIHGVLQLCAELEAVRSKLKMATIDVEGLEKARDELALEAKLMADAVQEVETL